MKKIIWTKEEEDYLIENYSNLSNKELCKTLNKTIDVLKSKSHSLKLKKSKEYFVNLGHIINNFKKNNWTKEEENYLIENYSNLGNEELSKILNRTIKSINIKSYRLGLGYKDNKKIIRKNSWTKEEENYLIENFSDTMNIELSEILNKSEHSIQMKSYKLGLKKSDSHKSKMIGRRNKMVGRDLNFNTLKEIAKKYKTRGEFQLNDPSAYTIARTKGYLNDICGHMVKNSYSVPQLLLCEYVKLLIDNNILYNTRQIIKPYELDIYVPKYNLAFEYDGKGWHGNNTNDSIKNDLCLKYNIKLIRFIENNRKYADDIKKQLIEKLDEINNHCKLNITENDILNINIDELYKNINDNLINMDDIKKIISKYTDLHTFKINEPKIYSKLVRIKKLELTKDLTRDITTWNINKSINEINYTIR